MLLLKATRRDAIANLPFPDCCLCHIFCYSPLCLKLIEKTTKSIQILGSILSDGQPQVYGSLLERFTSYRLANFGGVPFADFRVRSLTDA